MPLDNAPGLIYGPPETPESDDSPQILAEFERHSRKCQICRHPDREAIETEYRDWFHPSEIARRYEVPDRPLYRHLHAVGLVSRRNQNLRTILNRILERGAEKPLTDNTIIRAVRADCCLTNDNRCVEPTQKVIHEIVSHDGIPKEVAAALRLC